MSIVLYYRIMSAMNSDNPANITGEVVEEITHGDAIFARAKSKMDAMFPTEWENIANHLKGTTQFNTSINAVTTKTSNACNASN